MPFMNNLFHSGKVYFLGESQILISNFNYDGSAPDAFFYVGTTTESPVGTEKGGRRLQYPAGSERFALQNLFPGGAKMSKISSIRLV